MRVREFDQRCSDGNEYAVFTDGPYLAEFRVTRMADNQVTTREIFRGETAAIDAERRFTELVLKVIHGVSGGRIW